MREFEQVFVYDIFQDAAQQLAEELSDRDEAPINVADAATCW